MKDFLPLGKPALVDEWLRFAQKCMGAKLQNFFFGNLKNMMNMMKRLTMAAICAMVVLAGCRQKGTNGTQAPTGQDGAAAAADTVPMPVFLIWQAPYFEMLYWTDVQEPKADDTDAEYYETLHASWARQEAFRRRARQYTRLLAAGGDRRIAFVDEVLTDPDGHTPSIGQVHGREGIPSLCARYQLADELEETAQGIVAVTDSYLRSRRRLDIETVVTAEGDYRPLPDSIVTSLEQRYGMRASRSLWCSTIGGRYLQGCVQFVGEYKDVPEAEREDYGRSLAVEVLADSTGVYAFEQLGYYLSESDFGWNADDEGEYIPNTIEAAFAGPRGLELCYTRSAIESLEVGMAWLRDGQYVEEQMDMYQYMVDEEIPVWKSDIAAMEAIYHKAVGAEGKDVRLTKWAHCYVELNNEWIWLRDKEEQHGALFIRKDGQYRLVAIEDPGVIVAKVYKDYTYYLLVSRSDVVPGVFAEVFAFREGDQVEHFKAMRGADGNLSYTLNDKAIAPGEGHAYLDKLSDPETLDAYFTDTEAEQ